MIGRVRRYRGRIRIDLGSRVRPRFLYSDRGSPFRSAAHAESVLAAIRHRVVHGETLQRAVESFTSPRSSAHNVLALYDQYLVEQQRRCEQGLSPGYLRKLKSFGRHQLAWWTARTIHEITYAALDEWIASLSLSPKSRSNALGIMRSFVRWLHRTERIQAIPSFPSVPVAEHMPRILSRAEQDAIIAAIPADLRGIYLALRLGIRPGEARALVRGDYRDGMLSISRACQGPSSTAPIGPTKNRAVRGLVADEELATWISAHRQDAIGDAILFPGPSGKRWNHHTLADLWLRTARRLGIDSTLYEGTKHTSATHAREAGMPMEDIQALLGHRDARSTQIYARLRTPGSLRSVLVDPGK